MSTKVITLEIEGKRLLGTETNPGANSEINDSLGR